MSGTVAYLDRVEGLLWIRFSLVLRVLNKVSHVFDKFPCLALPNFPPIVHDAVSLLPHTRVVSTSPPIDLRQDLIFHRFIIRRSKATAISLSALIDNLSWFSVKMRFWGESEGEDLVKGSVDVDMSNIDVPMLVRLQWLLKALALLTCFMRPAPQPAGLTQHTKDTRWTDRHHIGVDHHVGQSPVSFQRILRLVVEDCFPLPLL